MGYETPLKRIIRLLDRTLDTAGGHFRLHYGLRNPPCGRGLGLAGVDSESLVEAYAAALERAYSEFAGRGWTEPRRDSATGRIPVYVFYTPEYINADFPFTHVNRGFSFIGLRSENGEPTRERMIALAQIEAAHEVLHVFTHVHRPLRGPASEHSRAWAWFDEATAVYAERLIFPDNPEQLRFSRYWVCQPELCLEAEDWPGGYFAGLFIQYLVQRFGHDFLRDVWHRAEEKERPIDTLDRLLREREEGCCLGELFGAGYCVDTYLRSFAQDVFRRFGDRSVTASFRLSPGETVALQEHDSLDWLSCRYYRLFLQGNVKTLQVVLEAEVPPAECHLGASLVLADGDVTFRRPITLRPEPAEAGGTLLTRLGGALSFDSDVRDHVVLVVANTHVPQDRWPTSKHAVQRFRFRATGL